jgi:hypothetical protein
MRISELLLHCCEGSASHENMMELESLLDQNRPAVVYCVDILTDLNYFHGLMQTPLSQPVISGSAESVFMSELDPQQQTALLGDFAEYEKKAAAVKIAEPPRKEDSPLISKITYNYPERSINKYSLAAIVLSAAALLAMILYVHLAPPVPYEVATVSDSINAQWSAGSQIARGARISSNSQPIRLNQGIIKIQTDDQVALVLEAPAEFQFLSYSSIILNYGKLFASVSEQGLGFSVVTPNSKIVDLGTEFAVLSQIDGSTEVYTYKGTVDLFAGEKSQAKTSQMITAGLARKIDRKNAAVQEIPLDETAVVRNISSEANFVWKGHRYFRLTDLLLGGNGFGTASRRTVEYDPVTGATVQTDAAWYRNSPAQLVAIPATRYLDGVFVPASDGGNTVISSAGHVFRDCPATSGLYYANIACYKGWAFFEPLQQSYEQQYKRFSDPATLYLHSNIGLTIDLNAVRSAVAGLKITSFSAFAGIIRMGDNTPDYSEADVWVLIDGQIRSSRKALGSDQGYNISVVLADTDRFLTLVVTDGGSVRAEGFPANHFDTCGFAEPVFELALP